LFLAFWLFVLSAMSYLERVNISIAGGSITDAYQLTTVQLGKVFSAMLGGYALLQTVGGRLADRFGARRVFTLGVFWWGIFTAATALVPGQIRDALYAFVAVRFLLGAGEAVRPGSESVHRALDPVPRVGNCERQIFAGVGAVAGS
jgi:MFS transporter, ACS family, glucarate transporter